MFFYVLTSQVTWKWLSLNIFKPLNKWIRITFEPFYSSESCHLSEYTLKWFGGLFDARPENFPPLFPARISCAALCNVFVRFFCLMLCNGFIPLPDLLKTGFTIIEFGLFYGDERLEAKIYRFLTFLTRWLCLFNRRQQKHFKYCRLNYSKPSLKHWTYNCFPKVRLKNSKTR